MKHRKYLFFFIATISVSLVVIGCIYNLISGKALEENFMSFFILNLPFGIIIGFTDLGIVYMTYKRLKNRSNTVRILTDMVLTTFVCILISGFTNYLLQTTNAFHLLKSTLPAIPWNWIIVLQIEIFFYNLRQTEMEKEKALYQFKILKNQINPHFLFNSLNVLASLAYQDAAKTNLFAKKLSSVYRYLLMTYEQQTVTLEEELAFVESYLYLEYIRFENTLQVEIEDHAEKNHRLVIPASVQMLVENAIKHNISTQKSPLIIHVAIGDTMIVVSNRLQLRNSVNQNGTGLQNLQRQYDLYHKRIEIVKNEKEFVVKIPFLD
ncbi:sensor histidine kinase [Culturomica massiliensis]|uniref:sensor histidine kinase n=1 Tax=Culturomica massiliensis TaxID=1841857 RepID=UPI00235795DA|nr:sensor histidine kinase [Culturomica massiliensis]